jgi:aryl-alcohol dehydrogenase-like predicted oxidoreductase
MLMNYRILGKTGLSISEIGLGCSGYWGDRNFSEKKAINIIENAYNLGINLFDTGHNYSNYNAEPRLGKALKSIFNSNARTDIVISTKAGSKTGYAPTVADNDTRFSDFSAESIEKSCIESIKNLQSEYIDVFQLHGFDKSTFSDQLARCLQELKRKGLVRCVGVNTHFKDDLIFVSSLPDVFDMVLTDCNVLQLERYEIIEVLTKKGIGVVVGTVLAQGHLVKRKVGSIHDGSFFWYLARTILKPTTRDFSKYSKPMRKVLSSIPEMSAAQAAFSYILENTNISSCIFGTTNLKNLYEVAESPNKKLTDQSKKKIEELVKTFDLHLGR